MSLRSDTAIDDVKFQAGSCAGNNIFSNYLSLTEKGICSSFKSQECKFSIFYIKNRENYIVYLSFLTEMEDQSQQSSGYSEDLNEIEY